MLMTMMILASYYDHLKTISFDLHLTHFRNINKKRSHDRWFCVFFEACDHHSSFSLWCIFCHFDWWWLFCLSLIRISIFIKFAIAKLNISHNLSQIITINATVLLISHKYVGEFQIFFFRDFRISNFAIWLLVVFLFPSRGILRILNFSLSRLFVLCYLLLITRNFMGQPTSISNIELRLRTFLRRISFVDSSSKWT